MADREDFTGDFELPPGHLSRSAEPALHLCRFEDRLLQTSLLAAQREHFVRKRLEAVGKIALHSRRAAFRELLVRGRGRGLSQLVRNRGLPDFEHSFSPGHHVAVTPRICSRLHERSENNEARRERVRVSGGCGRYARRRSGWLENFRSPTPRREGGRGSRSLPNDTENV